MAEADFSLFTIHCSLLIGWFLDLLIGDPAWLPHPVVGFGKMIAFGEHHLNNGRYRKVKGALMAIIYIIGIFVAVWFLRTILSSHLSPLATHLFDTVVIFFCLAGTTLIREVRQVFLALDRHADQIDFNLFLLVFVVAPPSADV